MTPSAQTTSIDDLARGVKRGILLVQMRSVNVDQQLASGLLYGGLMLEVNNGVITNRVTRTGLQFKTATLWKGVEAIGDVATCGHAAASIEKGQPWQTLRSTSRAPAMRCASIDVIQVGGR